VSGLAVLGDAGGLQRRGRRRDQYGVSQVAINKITYPDIDERRAMGLEARRRAPMSSHGKWRPAGDRPDPVALLEKQDRARVPFLVPVRHGRMMVSPFTFYRGAAAIMAADLAATPVAGLDAQLCGDAHLSNFGAFASPERRLVFDVNDFDETLPGPFEYDVKRMAASFTIAGRNNGYAKADTRDATLASLTSYRQAMGSFAQMRTMDIWYAHLDEDQVADAVRGALADFEKEATAAKKGVKKQAKKRTKEAKRAARSAAKAGVKAHTRDSLQALSKLGEMVDGKYRIVSQPPIVIPERDLVPISGISPDDLDQVARQQFYAYRATLRADQRHVLDRFQFVDMAHKVVGVGSVGNQAFIILLQGRDANDPLFLQVKQATASVLEEYLPKSRFRQHGQRVVEGQRMMQAASDIYLGWTRDPEDNRHYYWRQLRDMKGSADVEGMTPPALTFYASTCGWTLARAHARSGDPIAIAACLGESDAFDKSVTDFAQRYANQNERDYQQFVKAIRSGRMEALQGG
jgi:uncharacterized protein (DUF2252 family)